MNDGSSAGGDLGAELERRLAAETGMAASLVELERHPGYRLLETITPTGVTAQRWTAAKETFAGLWQDFMRYRSVVADARAVRDRRSRPGDGKRAELRRLLREPCIEVRRTVVRRRLAGAVEEVETITLEQLAERMEAAYAELDEFVSTCDALHSAHVAGLSPLLERMHGARLLADELATGPGSRPEAEAIAELDARLDGLARAAADPLGLADGRPAGELAALEAELAALTTRLAGLAAVRDDWDRRLAASAAALAELESLREEERQARERAMDLIAGHGLAAPADPVPVLRDRVARLGSPTGWSLRARRLDELDSAIGTAAATLRAAREQAAGLLERRAELRGRFEAYRAKAGRLGHAEHPEIMATGQEIERLLWSRPCDLPAATRALNAYQRTLTGMDAGRSA